MAIEIRNMSITSKVVQRQAEQGEDAVPRDDGGDGPAAPGKQEDWRVECRRMILELLELQRER